MKDEIIAPLTRNLRFIASKYYTSYLPAISKVCWAFDKFSLIFSKNSMFGYECVSPHANVSSRDEWPPDGESWGSRQLRPVGETRGDLRVEFMVLIMLWTSETEIIRCHGNAWTVLPRSFLKHLMCSVPAYPRNNAYNLKTEHGNDLSYIKYYYFIHTYIKQF